MKKLLLAMSLISIFGGSLAHATNVGPYSPTDEQLSRGTTAMGVVGTLETGMVFLSYYAPIPATVLGSVTLLVTTVLDSKGLTGQYRERVVAALREDAAAFVASDGQMVSELLSGFMDAAFEQTREKNPALADALNAMDIAKALVTLQ